MEERDFDEQVLKAWREIYDSLLDFLEERGVCLDTCLLDSGHGRALGSHLWQKCRDHGMNETMTRYTCHAMADKIGYGEDDEYHAMRVGSLMYGLVQQAQYAFPTLTTSHTCAALLMCTDVSEQVIEGLRMPWPALDIILPEGLVPSCDHEGEPLPSSESYKKIFRIWPEPHHHLNRSGNVRSSYCSAVITSNTTAQDHLAINFNRHLSNGQPEEAIEGLLNPNQDGPTFTSLSDYRAATTASYVYLGSDALREGPKANDKATAYVKAVMNLMRRLAVGLLLTYNYKPSEVSITEHTSKGKHVPGRKQREPNHRVVHISDRASKHLGANALAEVRRYMSGAEETRQGHPLMVQVCVRGHYQHYWTGSREGERERVLKWKMPYWKGKVDAPIVSVPREVIP